MVAYGRLMIGFDYSQGDIPVLTVLPEEGVTKLYAYSGEKALDLYSKLLKKKPDEIEKGIEDYLVVIYETTIHSDGMLLINRKRPNAPVELLDVFYGFTAKNLYNQLTTLG